MERLIRSYAAPGVIAYFVQLVVAFAIGTSSTARWDESSDLSLADVPTPLIGAFQALGVTAFLITVGYALRVIAYARLDRAAIRGRATWWAIVIGETIYVVLSAWIAWVATEPVNESGFAWLLAFYLGVVVTIASVVILIVAIIVTRRRKARALARAT